jgi:hypothetical protein
MTSRSVALFCCLSLVTGSVVSAQGQPARAQAPKTLRDALTDTTRIARYATSAPARQTSAQQSNWAERHPVWTGAIVGFSVGVGLTYLAGQGDDRDQLFKGTAPSSVALFYGGIGAGIGALAGWGIGKNREPDDDPPVSR